MNPLIVYQEAVTNAFDVLIRFVLIPSFGLWAFYRLVREVADEVRAFRSGRDSERTLWRSGVRW